MKLDTRFFRPKLLDSLPGYDRTALARDVGAGLTVGVVALPLAMAFAIASGLKPEAGLFTAHGIDNSFDNDGWIGAARAVYAPNLGNGRLHLALNYQHREFQSNNGGVASVSANAPSTNQVARYRARPFLQTTDVRFVDTGSFAEFRKRFSEDRSRGV